MTDVTKGIKRLSEVAEEKQLKAVRARRRFKAIIRFVIDNLGWLVDSDEELTETTSSKGTSVLQKNKTKKSILTFSEKILLCKPAEYRTDFEKMHLDRTIGDLRCFKRYPQHVKYELARVSYFVYFPTGRIIVQENHPALALYFVLSGELVSTKTEWDPIDKLFFQKKIGRFVPGDTFGEVALLYDVPRAATTFTVTPCEFLCISKDDFDRVLKNTIQKEWDDIRQSIKRFRYFDNLTEKEIRECCTLSKKFKYKPEDTIYGDGYGLTNFTYFILDGTCSMIEQLIMKQSENGKKKMYKLLRVNDPAYIRESQINIQSNPPSESISIKSAIVQQQQHIDINKKMEARLRLMSVQSVGPLINRKSVFIQVCLLNELGCFGLGENLTQRRIVAVTPVTCLLIPRYWLLEHNNRDNLWTRIRQYLDAQIPTRVKVFNKFKMHRKWLTYRKSLVHDILSKKKIPNDTNIHDVPLSIRVLENLKLN